MTPTNGKHRRWRPIAAITAASAAGIALAGHAWWASPRPTPPVEIFRGVVYSCEDIQRDECHGRVCIVRVDLSAPGIGLYLTPLDPIAVSRGYQYHLATPAAVLQSEHLAVSVNGALFSADSPLVHRTGDLARGVQTVISDGEVSHVDPHSYLLWFEADLTPHMEVTKPPPETVLHRAKWGIGGSGVLLWNGQVREAAAAHDTDRRTAVGIDAPRRLLWLAVFENASSLAVARVLEEHGVKDGFLLDGGHSTAIVLASGARGEAGDLDWRLAAGRHLLRH